jgi:hypothetical protein
VNQELHGKQRFSAASRTHHERRATLWQAATDDLIKTTDPVGTFNMPGKEMVSSILHSPFFVGIVIEQRLLT